MKLFLKWIYNILIGIDQLINAIFGGDPDETISSRLGKNMHRRGWTRLANFVDHLFFWQENHCFGAIEHDEGKNQVTHH